MIRFYYGAGSIQTNNALLNAIRASLASGGEVLLLVPEQQTVSVERRMLQEFPPAAQLHFEVVNFSRLANRTFRVLGGHRFHTATGAVRALLMWRALSDLSPLLTRYAGHAKETRLCDMMLQTATRCRAHRIGANELLAAADKLDRTEPLRDKLTDIGTVLGAFEGALAAKFDNGDDDLDRLAELVRENGTLFANTHVFVDSFHDFTGQEYAVLEAIATHAASLSFTLPQDGPSHEGLHLETAARTQRTLRRMADRLSLEVEFVRPTPKKPQTAREYLAANLFCMDAEKAPLGLLEAPDVSLTLCATPFAEADAAAAKIHELVRNGCRYRDITLVVRDANAWGGILDAALEREGIPFYLSEKTDVTVRPLIKMILLALRIHKHAFRDQDVIAYAKTGLCGALSDDINCFEEYVNLWHPRGMAAYEAPFSRNPDGFTAERTPRGERILAGANATREIIFAPLCELFSALERAQNVTDMCRALYAYLDALHVREQMSASAAAMLAAGNRREAEELSRLYTVTVEALEELSAALGEEKLSTAELLDALQLVFSRTDIGTIPTSTDEVTIGSADMLRADRPRHVLVLGLNEGCFPRPVKDDDLIGESERERLAALDLHLPGARAEQSSNELFFIHRVFCAPYEGLYLSYSKASANGGTLMPSIAVTRTKKLLSMREDVFEQRAPLDSIYTSAAALDRLCDFEHAEREALTALLCELDVPAAHTLSRPVSAPCATVDGKTASDLFDHMRVSASALERYTSCRFAYYCERILALREKKSNAPSHMDTGNFIHHVLEHALASAKAKENGFASLTGEEIDTMVNRIATTYRDELIRANSELTPRSDALLSRLTTVAKLVVHSLAAEFGDAAFTPAVSEFNLADTDARPYLDLPNGKRVDLAGKIDRIDVWRSEAGEAFVRVVDYKTGEKSFSQKDVAKGSSLQMPLYLMKLCDKPYPALNEKLGLPPDTKLSPAGVTYFSSKVKMESTPSRKDAALVMREAEENMVRSGVVLNREDVLDAASKSANPAIIGKPDSDVRLDEDGFGALFSDLVTAITDITEDMRSGNASAAPQMRDRRSPCNGCDFAAVCRAAQKTKEGDF